MCPESKAFLKIFLAKLWVRERLSRKPKYFSIRVELARDLDYLCLKESFLLDGSYKAYVGDSGFK